MKIPYRTKTKLIDLANLTPEDICSEDIACSLAGQARFNGITRPLYSVSQHSVLCSMVAPFSERASMLLHDAHEYILSDISGPAIKLIELESYDEDCIYDIKDHIDTMITVKFGVKLHGKHMAEVDARMLATEMLYFFGKNYTESEPYENILTEVWDTDRAEKEFLKRLGELIG